MSKNWEGLQNYWSQCGITLPHPLQKIETDNAYIERMRQMAPCAHVCAIFWRRRSEGQSFGFWDLDNYVANLGCWEPHPVLPNDGQFAKQEQESLKYQLVDVFGCPNPTNTKMSFLLLERLLPADNLWSSKLKCCMMEDYMHDAWIYVFRIHTLYAKHILTC